jgi:hypothetical protein
MKITKRGRVIGGVIRGTIPKSSTIFYATLDGFKNCEKEVKEKLYKELINDLENNGYLKTTNSGYLKTTNLFSKNEDEIITTITLTLKINLWTKTIHLIKKWLATTTRI